MWSQKWQSKFDVIAGHLLPLTQITSKGQYVLVQPFAVFCAERRTCPALTTNWVQGISVVLSGIFCRALAHLR